MTEFSRENRYIVIKRKDLTLIGWEEAESIQATIDHIQDIFRSADAPDREYLVIESDWPEYEPTWRAIEDRVSGAAQKVAAVGLPERMSLFGSDGNPTYETKSWNACLDAVEPLVAQLQAEVSAWRGTAGRRLYERDALRAEVNRTEIRLHEVAVACATAEQERDALRGEVERLNKSNEEYSGAAVDAGMQNDGLRAQNAELVKLLRDILGCQYGDPLPWARIDAALAQQVTK